MRKPRPKKVPTTRIWGGSVKYALWTLAHESCVIMGNSLHTDETKRLVFKDAEELTQLGLARVVGDNMVLTPMGRDHVPNGVSHVSRYAALKIVDKSNGLRFCDGHAVGDDGGKVSRYVAEVLIAQGYLTFDESGRIVRNESDSTESWRNALWTLSNEPCYIEDDVLKAKSDGRLVFHDPHSLEVNSYIDRHGQITDLGRRMVPKSLGYTTVIRALEVFSEIPGRWRYQGHFALGENGGRLPRYTVERLVAIGKLQIDTGGYITLPEERTWVKFYVTAAQREQIERLVK